MGVKSGNGIQEQNVTERRVGVVGGVGKPTNQSDTRERERCCRIL